MNYGIGIQITDISLQWQSDLDEALFLDHHRGYGILALLNIVHMGSCWTILCQMWWNNILVCFSFDMNIPYILCLLLSFYTSCLLIKLS